MKKNLSATQIYLIYTGVSALLFQGMRNVREFYRIDIAHLNPFQLVLIGTTLELTSFIFEIPTGIVADRYSRKLSVIIGLCLVSIAFILEGVVPLFSAILISQFILGLGDTFTSGADEAWIADELNEGELDLVLLKGTQIGQIFSILGIIISTFLGLVIINLPFLISGVLFSMLAIFLIFFMEENYFKSSSEINSYKQMFNSIKLVKNNIKAKPVLVLMVWITLFYGLYSEGPDRMYTLHLLENIDKININPFLSISIFVNLVALFLSIIAVEYIKRQLKRTKQMNKVWLLFIINILMFITLLLFSLAGQFYISASLYISFYIVRKINQPVYRAWINQNIEPNIRATVLSTYGQLDSLGQIIGGPIIGYIALKTSTSIGLLVSAIIFAPVIVIYLYFIKKTRVKIA